MYGLYKISTLSLGCGLGVGEVVEVEVDALEVGEVVEEAVDLSVEFGLLILVIRNVLEEKCEKWVSSSITCFAVFAFYNYSLTSLPFH